MIYMLIHMISLTSSSIHCEPAYGLSFLFTVDACTTHTISKAIVIDRTTCRLKPKCIAIDIVIIEECLTPNKALKYFCTNHGNQRVFSILIHHQCLKSALSASFEYLCYGSTAIRNIFTLTVWVSILDVTI